MYCSTLFIFKERVSPFSPDQMPELDYYTFPASSQREFLLRKHSLSKERYVHCIVFYNRTSERIDRRGLSTIRQISRKLSPRFAQNVVLPRTNVRATCAVPSNMSTPYRVLS